MNEAALLQNYLLIGGLLFAIGMTGFLVRRNMIVMFLCAEMMLQGVSVSLVGWGRYHGNWGGQMLIIFVIAIAAAEAGIALAMVMTLYLKSGTLDVAFWQDLREEGQPPFIDRQVPEVVDREPSWPTLTTAGVEPGIETDDQMHRTRV